MRIFATSICVLSLAGCTAFPRSAEQATVDIRAIVDSIECELAAVATSKDPEVRGRDIINWIAATEVDMTLVRSISADGSVNVAGPLGLATISGVPSAGINDKDTRTNSIKFANSFRKAVAHFGDTCSGPDPSETHMGLAYWFEGSVKAVGKDSLVSLSFTKQFQVVATAGARFGYTLIPVTNPVVAGAGLGGSSDYTNRFTIALTPPPPPAPAPKPVAVVVTNWPQTVSPPSISPDVDRSDEGRARPQRIPSSPDAAQTTPRVTRPLPRQAPRSAPQPDLTPRQRVLQNPELNQMLQRQSPVILSPGSVR
jgi:hypothetical protein